MLLKRDSIRPKFEFWLSRESKNPVERWLIEQIPELKRQRRFAETVRDGMNLVISLRAGSTAVLETLFPSAVKKLIDSHTNTKLEQLTRELATLRAQLETASPAPPPKERQGGTDDGILMVTGLQVEVGKNFLSSMKGFRS